MPERAARGAVLAFGVTVGIAILDAQLGMQAQISGSYVLGAFLAAMLTDVRTTTAVAALALLLSVLSPIWNHNLGSTDYLVKLSIVALGDVFAIQTARLRARLVLTLRRQSTLAALADLPAPGETLEQTVGRVTDLLVPGIVGFAAIDEQRGKQLERVASRGTEPLSRDPGLATSLRVGGREVGALTVGGRGAADLDPEFLKMLSGRVALAMGNAGLSRELSTVEQRLDAILANLGEAVTVQDHDGRLVFANQAAADLLGAASVEELLATPAAEFIERFDSFNEDGSPLRADQLPGRQVLEGQRAVPLIVRAVNKGTRSERWRLTKSTAIFGPGGEVALAVNIIEDITDAKRAELGQRLLADASAVLASSLDYEHTLQRVAELAVPQLADWCSVSVPRGVMLAPVAVAHSDPAKVEWARRYSERYPSRIDAREGAAEVLRSGRSRLVPVVTDAMIDAAPLDDDQRQVIRELGMTSVMTVPLATPEGAAGVMSMVAAESGRRFNEADLALAEELGRRAGTALENSRLHTEIEEVAQTLQRSLLPPPLPTVEGWSFRSLYMPASGHTDVGGDFYDVFPTAAGWMAVIGDVAGRGPSAASLTSMARYTLRTAGSLVGTPTMGLARLNDHLRERGEMALCTAAIVLLRDQGEECSIVCAGHPLPLLVRDGQVQPVGRTGPLLGAFEHGHWLPAPIILRPRDVLVLYTDGVLDAKAAHGDERFGEERLAQTLEGTSGDEETVRRIRAALEEFSGGEHTDDTAVLTIMRV